MIVSKSGSLKQSAFITKNEIENSFRHVGFNKVAPLFECCKFKHAQKYLYVLLYD